MMQVKNQTKNQKFNDNEYFVWPNSACDSKNNEIFPANDSMNVSWFEFCRKKNQIVIAVKRMKNKHWRVKAKQEIAK